MADEGERERKKKRNDRLALAHLFRRRWRQRRVFSVRGGDALSNIGLLSQFISSHLFSNLLHLHSGLVLYSVIYFFLSLSFTRIFFFVFSRRFSRTTMKTGSSHYFSTHSLCARVYDYHRLSLKTRPESLSLDCRRVNFFSSLSFSFTHLFFYFFFLFFFILYITRLKNESQPKVEGRRRIYLHHRNNSANDSNSLHSKLFVCEKK